MGFQSRKCSSIHLRFENNLVSELCFKFYSTKMFQNKSEINTAVDVFSPTPNPSPMGRGISGKLLPFGEVGWG